MKTVENNSEKHSSVTAYLEEQNAIVRSGSYWNCLVAARKLSALLLAEGRNPWIGRLRKREDRGDHIFHGPLIPRPLGIAAAWTTHYVCCCEEMAYDPLAGKTIRLEEYSLRVFGEQISMEVFVSTHELPVYLAGNRLL
ncbi:MAG TPA: hypothetical protein VF658_09150 [Pyrinomonadaceae bacterium]|jgi:hypothetical protein